MDLGDINTRPARGELVFDPTRVRSEAVHVNQIGYRPDDPAKRAFVSCWMGTGGVLKLPEVVKFALVDDASRKIVFQGIGERHFPADKAESMAREVNFNGTDVARCDFSTFSTPGRYRVVLEGVGCSFPFDIQPDVWRKAFLTQMRGLYHQRSGVELGPPYTNYRKPRDMHPADDYRATKTRYRAVEKGGEAWAEIPAGDTGEAVPQSWGGYHDAGDWNPRRVTHMRANMASLEMLDLFPETFAALKLNIPPTPGLPDILTEALFEVECFMRLQQADGGVSYGMESKGDPATGEVSWLSSFPSYVFAGDYAAIRSRIAMTPRAQYPARMQPRPSNGNAMRLVLPFMILVLASSLRAAQPSADGPFSSADLAGWNTPTGDWKTVKSVALDPADTKQFTVTPGTGVWFNGGSGRTANLVSVASYGDVSLHVEFCLPKASNSGVYLMGRYEVQVYDSFGVAKDKYPGIECGGIYPRWTEPGGEFEGHSPRVNASKPPGEWQSFDVVFRAPRFDSAGRKTRNARFVKVAHNGKVIHENIEVTGPTRAALWEKVDDEKPVGPLMLQGDHGPVAYRNLRIEPLAAE